MQKQLKNTKNQDFSKLKSISNDFLQLYSKTFGRKRCIMMQKSKTQKKLAIFFTKKIFLVDYKLCQKWKKKGVFRDHFCLRLNISIFIKKLFEALRTPNTSRNLVMNFFLKFENPNSRFSAKRF